MISIKLQQRVQLMLKTTILTHLRLYQGYINYHRHLLLLQGNKYRAEPDSPSEIPTCLWRERAVCGDGIRFMWEVEVYSEMRV